MSSTVTKFSVPCSKESLKGMRDEFSALLTNSGITGTLRNQLVLAVDEACANAIIHGNNCDLSKKIAMEVQISDEYVEIRVYDVGKFELKPEILKKDLQQLIRERSKGGLGLKLMHAIMDEVNYEMEDDLFVCTLRKNLN